MNNCWNAEKSALSSLGLGERTVIEIAKIRLKQDGTFNVNSLNALTKVRGSLNNEQARQVRAAIEECKKDAEIAAAAVDRYLSDFDVAAGKNTSLEKPDTKQMAKEIAASIQLIQVIPGEEDLEAVTGLTLERDLYMRSDKGWYEKHIRDKSGKLTDIVEIMFEMYGVSSSSIVDEVIKIMTLTATKVERAFLFHEDKIPFLNGVYDLKDGQLYPWKSGDQYLADRGVFVYGLPRNYIPGASLPKSIFIELDKIFGKKCKLVKQFCCAVGMSATSSKSTQKTIFGVGPGSNGKSTLDNLLHQVYGRTFGKFKIHKVINNTFASSRVEGRLICIDDDASSVDIEQNGVFNELVTSRYLNVEKKYERERTVLNLMTLWIFTNAIPRIGNAETFAGVMRRVHILPFESHFHAKYKKDDWKNRQFPVDPAAITRIYDDIDMDTFISYCVDVYREEWLVASSVFGDLDESQLKFEKEYREKIDVVERYLNTDGINVSDMDGVHVNDMLENIRTFMKAEGMNRVMYGNTIRKRVLAYFTEQGHALSEVRDDATGEFVYRIGDGRNV